VLADYLKKSPSKFNLLAACLLAAAAAAAAAAAVGFYCYFSLLDAVEE
jgi:succinate dehydrogenase hydrophobic anchor subunit